MKPPRFTLRDLFWLVLVVGLACAWWVDRTHLVNTIAALTRQRFFPDLEDHTNLR